MIEPTRIKVSVLPEPFQYLGNNKWYYNYDRRKDFDIVGLTNENIIDNFNYSYIQIEITGTISYKKCVECVIREYITQSQEFDLINTHNRASLNLLSEEEKEIEGIKYLEYLNKVEEIKSKVKQDFEGFNSM